MTKIARNVGQFILIVMLTVVLPVQTAYAHGDAPPADSGAVPPNEQVYPEMRLAPPKQRSGSAQIMGPIPGTIITDRTLDMKVLVVYGNGYEDLTLGTEHPYSMVSSYLDILGIPYDTVDLDAGETIAENDLWDGVSHGYYYAIFFTTSNDWWALPLATREMVAAYERNFSVREVTWYAVPNPSHNGMQCALVDPACFSGGGMSGPIDVDLTATGQTTFPYLQPDNTLSALVLSAYTYGYPGTIATGADVTPLLTDANGNIAMAIYRPGDGREHLAFTWSSYYPATPPVNVHARVLPYGIINWATKGVFLGQRHVYFVPQPDDVLSWGDIWDSNAHVLREGQFYRLEPNDLDNIVAWMANLRATTPNAADFKMEMPFNGDGSTQDRVNGNGSVNPGTLTAKAVELENEFIWLNHTYTHADLYFTDYTTNYQEIDQNNQLAAFLPFTDYTNQTLLTGAYSGITNTALISAAYDLGIRYLLVNASYPQYDNPTPNTGIPHPYNSAVLQVPRHANNVFYFSTTPDMETDYYNWTYCPAYRANPIPANRCLEYPDVIDTITDQSLENLLDFNVNATMFHMNNLEVYNESTGGTDTILSDFVESLYGKYNALYNDNVPILSLRTQDIGALMRERAAYDAAGVSAVWSCGDALTVTVTTTSIARIPVTGVNYGSDTESYAGQDISYFTMASSAPVSIPGTENPTTPAAPTGLSVIASGSDNALTWITPTLNTNGGAIDVLAYRVYRSPDPNFTPSPATLYADRVPGPTYTDVGAASGGYTYVVTAIGDNCWQRESEGARVAPTAVQLLDFTTVVIEGGIEVVWETATELNTVGFNLYRAPTETGAWTQLNTNVIPGQAFGGVLGATYAFLDTDANPNALYYYRLEEVATNDARTFYGPITGGLNADPSAITLVNLHAQTSSTGSVAQVVIAALVAGTAAVIAKRSREKQR